MYKLLIVDDEVIERQAMRHMLMHSIEDAEIVGEAVNGKEAVRLADELVPDIILMDIKMPGMDGVEAVKIIRKSHPRMKFIMVSAFDTFEYARKVMHEGVKEYLLKPSKKDEILETVQRVIEEVASERKEEQHQQLLEGKLDRALSFIRSEWVTSLLLDHIQETEAAEWRDFLDLDEGAVYAVVCRLLFSESEHPIKTKKQYYALLKEAFNEHVNCLVGPMAGGQIPIFIIEGAQHQSARAEAVGMAKDVLRVFDQAKSRAGIRIGIGTPVNHVNDFIRSYEEALAALEQTNEHVRYMIYHPSLIHEIEAKTREKQLLEAVKEGDVDGVHAAFEHYVRQLEGDSETVREKLENLIWVVTKIGEEMGFSLQIPVSFPKDADDHQLLEVTRVRLIHAVEEIHNWQSDEVHGLLQEARHYIDDHYNEEVSLEDVAAHVDLSPYYFSKLFKEQNGTSFIDYLTGIRIRQGKELLKETRLSLKEICFKVGYHDPNYFSRVFKKNTGRTPSEYRASVKGTKTKDTYIN
jgi:two-component system response regulator YesN